MVEKVKKVVLIEYISVLRYEVQVITGNLWNSGTEANVYMTLYGDRGDTGVRQLYPGKRTSVFEKGNVSIINITMKFVILLLILFKLET